MGRAPRAPRARRRLALLPVGLERAQGCAHRCMVGWAARPKSQNFYYRIITQILQNTYKKLTNTCNPFNVISNV